MPAVYTVNVIIPLVIMIGFTTAVYLVDESQGTVFVVVDLQYGRPAGDIMIAMRTVDDSATGTSLILQMHVYLPIIQLLIITLNGTCT